VAASLCEFFYFLVLIVRRGYADGVLNICILRPHYLFCLGGYFRWRSVYMWRLLYCFLCFSRVVLHLAITRRE